MWGSPARKAGLPNKTSAALPTLTLKAGIEAQLRFITILRKLAKPHHPCLVERRLNFFIPIRIQIELIKLFNKVNQPLSGESETSSDVIPDCNKANKTDAQDGGQEAYAGAPAHDTRVRIEAST